MDVFELKNSTVAELQGYAESLNIPHDAGLRKQDLIFRIYEGLARRDEAPRIEGVLDVMPDGAGFLRSAEWNYLQGPDDVFVAPEQIRSLGLRRGDLVAGFLRPPTRGDRRLVLKAVERVNGGDPGALQERPTFEEMRPWYPVRRLTLETPGGDVGMRMIDLVAPVGRGQRGLIVSPPKAGKTTILRKIAQAVTANHPEVVVVVLLIDERPEEVTEMRECVRGEVVASTFDERPARHRQVAEMTLEKAKRQVENGRDVVILLDSITRLARAYNSLARHSGRILSGGVDAYALQRPKRFFGSARSFGGAPAARGAWPAASGTPDTGDLRSDTGDNGDTPDTDDALRTDTPPGGSLTIVATALVETGSRMDEVIFEEFKGTGNMELVLDREAADQRIFPAIDLNRSGTRREELLLSPKELNRVYLLRNFLAEMPAPEAVSFLTDRLARHSTNAEFLAAMAAGE